MKYIVLKPSLLIKILLPLLIGTPFACINLINMSDSTLFEQIISWLMMTVFVAGFIYFILRFFIFYKFEISEYGVSFKKFNKLFKLNWSEINFIGIASNGSGVYSKNSFIYFDARRSNIPLQPICFKNYNALFFGVQYRNNIIRDIRKYWTKPIIGIYQVEGEDKNPSSI